MRPRADQPGQDQGPRGNEDTQAQGIPDELRQGWIEESSRELPERSRRRDRGGSGARSTVQDQAEEAKDREPAKDRRSGERQRADQRGMRLRPFAPVDDRGRRTSRSWTGRGRTGRPISGSSPGPRGQQPGQHRPDRQPRERIDAPRRLRRSGTRASGASPGSAAHPARAGRGERPGPPRARRWAGSAARSTDARSESNRRRPSRAASSHAGSSRATAAAVASITSATAPGGSTQSRATTTAVHARSRD